MTTIKCNIEEFNQAFCYFNREIGNKSNSQESIGNLYKGLVLHYLGLQNVTDEEVEKCATWLEVATRQATMRGWLLETPDLTGEQQEQLPEEIRSTP